MKKVVRIDAGGYFVEDVILQDNDPVPSDCVEVAPPDGLYKAQFVNGAWAETYSIPLVDVQQAKIAELLAAREASIRDNFTSQTTGHTYFYGDSDQSKLRGQGVLLSLDPTISSVDWLTVDAGMVSHTRDQFIAVLKDGGQHERDQHTKFYTLKAQVEAATTVADVQAIVW